MDALDKVLSLTIDEALEHALAATNDRKELESGLYEVLASKLGEEEKQTFALGLAAQGVKVRYPEPLLAEGSVKGRALRDYMRRRQLLELLDEREGGIDREAFDILTDGVEPEVREHLAVWAEKQNRKPKTKPGTKYQEEVSQEVKSLLARQEFRIGQTVVNERLRCRGKVVEVDRDLVGIQHMIEGVRVNRYSLAPVEDATGWRAE